MSNAYHFEDFEDFWPYYVHQHSHPATRLLHFAGTSAALVALGYGLLRRRPLALVMVPVLGHGPALLGHLLFEDNLPTGLRHPLWSLRASWRMYGLTLAGKMAAEVERVQGLGSKPWAEAGPTTSCADGGNGAAAEEGEPAGEARSGSCEPN